MRTAIFLFLVVFFFPTPGNAQAYSWKLITTYKNKNIDAWDINPIAQVILASGSKIYKLDTNFQVIFTQSNVDFGQISKLDASHSLKTLVFSKSNQLLGILDNALTFHEGIIDMGELQVSYATNVCYSDQSELIWVYDETNSKLIRFYGLKSNKRRSEISNLSSITKSFLPTSLKEKNHKLFLFYRGNGVFVFDYYGSLITKIKTEEALQVYPTEKYLYLLKKESIVRINRRTRDKESIQLPYRGIEDFRVAENYIFFKDKEGLKKYYLIPPQ